MISHSDLNIIFDIPVLEYREFYNLTGNTRIEYLKYFKKDFTLEEFDKFLLNQYSEKHLLKAYNIDVRDYGFRYMIKDMDSLIKLRESNIQFNRDLKITILNGTSTN